VSAANDLTNAIIQYIRFRGGLAWRNNSGAFAGNYTDKHGQTRGRFVRFGERGSGDVLALLDGRFYSIEVKAGRDKLKPAQIEWMESVNARGGCAFEARSLDDVTKRIVP
jgi:hypothetical protein